MAESHCQVHRTERELAIHGALVRLGSAARVSRSGFYRLCSGVPMTATSSWSVCGACAQPFSASQASNCGVRLQYASPQFSRFHCGS